MVEESPVFSWIHDHRIPLALVVKKLPANAGDVRDVGSILGSGRSPEEGNGNPLQYSCLENPTDRGAWQATIHRSQTWLKQLNTYMWSQEIRTIFSCLPSSKMRPGHLVLNISTSIMWLSWICFNRHSSWTVCPFFFVPLSSLQARVLQNCWS